MLTTLVALLTLVEAELGPFAALIRAGLDLYKSVYQATGAAPDTLATEFLDLAQAAVAAFSAYGSQRSNIESAAHLAHPDLSQEAIGKLASDALHALPSQGTTPKAP